MSTVGPSTTLSKNRSPITTTIISQSSLFALAVCMLLSPRSSGGNPER